jgi:hypothetical protein
MKDHNGHSWIKIRKTKWQYRCNKCNVRGVKLAHHTYTAYNDEYFHFSCEEIQVSKVMEL